MLSDPPRAAGLGLSSKLAPERPVALILLKPSSDTVPPSMVTSMLPPVPLPARKLLPPRPDAPICDESLAKMPPPLSAISSTMPPVADPAETKESTPSAVVVTISSKAEMVPPFDA